jgi:adenosine deaminase
MSEPGLKRVESGKANRVDLTPKQKLVALIASFNKSGSLSSTEITILRELLTKHSSLFKTLSPAQQIAIKGMAAKYGNGQISVGAGLKVVINPPAAAPQKPVTIPPQFRGTKHTLVTVTNGQSHETIIAKGDANSKYVYFIAKGEVEVHIRPGVVKTLKTGSFVGEIGTFLDIPRTADVKMKAGAVLLRMDKADFKTLLKSNRVLKDQIFALIKKRLSEDVTKFLSSRKMLPQKGKINAPINSPAKPIPAIKIYRLYKKGGFPAVAQLMLNRCLELALTGKNEYLQAMLNINDGKATARDAQLIFSMISSGQTHLHPTRSIPPKVVLEYGLKKLAKHRNNSTFWDRVHKKTKSALREILLKQYGFQSIKDLLIYAEKAKASGNTANSARALEALKKIIEYKPAEGKWSLVEYLKYGSFLSTLLYETPKDIADMSYEVAKSHYNRGIRYLELRFSPLQGKIPIATAIEHYVKGLLKAQAEFSGLRCKAIIIFDTTMTREPIRDKFGKVVEPGAIDLKKGILEFIRKNPALAKSVIGIDTAGPEVSKTAGGVELPLELAKRLGGKMTRNGQTHYYFDIKKFADIFTALKARGLSITLHSGENYLNLEQGFDNIEKAIRLGAKRLGHGIILGTDIDQYVKDLLADQRKTNASQKYAKDVFGREYTPKRIAALKARQTALLKLVAHQGIVIEVCPDSNLHTSPLTYKQHPINKFLSYGIRITVSNDNSALDNTSGSQQILQIARHQRLSPFRIFKLFLSSSTLALDKVKTKGAYGLLDNVRKIVGKSLEVDIAYLRGGKVRRADSRFAGLLGQDVKLPTFKGDVSHYEASNVPEHLKKLVGPHKHLYLLKVGENRVVAVSSDVTIDFSKKINKISRTIANIGLIKQYSVDNVGARTLARYYIDMNKALSFQSTNIHQIVINLSSPAKSGRGWGLKTINDKYGHKAGTAALKEINRRLNVRFGDKVRVYRLGANFVIHFEYPLANSEMETYIKEMIKEFESPITVKDADGREIFTERLSTFIRGFKYRNENLNGETSIGIDKFKRWVKWFTYQLNAIPQGGSEIDGRLVHPLTPNIGKIPHPVKYSVPKVRRSNKLLLKMIGFVQKHINSVDPALVAELFRTAYLEPDSELLTYESIRLLMKKGFFKTGTWSISALDGNRFGAFIKTYKSLGSDLLEVIIGKRMRYLAETFLAKKGCVLFRHGANSEEFYIVGKMAPEKLAGIIKDFYTLLAKKLEVDIPLERLTKTPEGEAFYQKNKANLKVSKVGDVDYVRINVQLLPRGTGAERMKGISMTAAVSRLDNIDPVRSFNEANRVSEGAKRADRKANIVLTSKMPKALFKAYGIKFHSPEVFDKFASHNQKAFSRFVIRLWKLGIRKLDWGIVNSAMLEIAKAKGVAATDITEEVADKVIEKIKTKIKRIKGSKFSTLQALDAHLKGLDGKSYAIYTDGKLVVSKRNARRYVKALKTFKGILNRASASVGNRITRQQLLLNISEVVRSRKVKRFLSRSRRQNSTFTEKIKLSDGSSVKLTFSKGSLKVALVPGLEVEISRGELLELAKGTRSFETILRSAMRLNKGMSRDTVTSFLLERFAEMTETQIDSTKGRTLSTHLVEVSGKPSEIRSAILTKAISVEKAPGKFVNVDISIIDFRALRYYKSTDPRYQAAMQRVQKAIKNQAGVSDVQAAQKTKGVVEGLRLSEVSVNAKLFFRNAAENVGIKVLRAAVENIKPGDPKFDQKLKAAYEKAQLAMVKFNLRAYQLMMGEVAKGGFTSLGKTQIETLFQRLANKVSGEVRGLTREQYIKDIKLLNADIKAKTKTWGGRMALRAEYYNTGAPNGSTGTQLKAVGFNATKGALMGAALTAPVSIVRQLLQKGEISGLATLKEMLHSGLGWAKFEAMSTLAKMIGMGEFGAMGVAIGIPHLWELRAADPAQRGVIFSVGATNLAAFLGTSKGVSVLLARMAPKMPGWIGKGITLGAAMLVSMFATLGINIGIKNSKTFRKIVNNPVTRTLGNIGAAASTPLDIYVAGQVIKWAAVRAGASKLAGRAILGAARLAGSVATVVTVLTWEKDIKYDTNLHGSLKSLVNGGVPLSTRYALAGRNLVFGRKRKYIKRRAASEYQPVGQKTAGVYFQVGYYLYKKGYLKGSVKGISFKSIFGSGRITSAYKKALASESFRFAFSQSVNEAIVDFKDNVRAKGIMLDGDVNPKYRRWGFVRRNYIIFKAKQAQAAERRRITRLKGFLTRGAQKIVAHQKQALIRMKINAKKQFKRTLGKFIIGTARGLQEIFGIRSIGRARNIVDYMVRGRKGDMQRVARLLKRYGRKNVTPENIAKITQYVSLRYGVVKQTALKMYLHLVKQIRTKQQNFKVQLPWKKTLAFYRYLRKKLGINWRQLKSYLGEGKFVKYYAKYLMDVEAPKEMRLRLRNIDFAGKKRQNLIATFKRYLKSIGRNVAKNQTFTMESLYKSSDYKKFIEVYLKQLYNPDVEGSARRVGRETTQILKKQLGRRRMFFSDITDGSAFKKFLLNRYPDLFGGRNYRGLKNHLGTGTIRALLNKNVGVKRVKPEGTRIAQR